MKTFRFSTGVRSQSIIEFALIAPLFFSMVLVTTLLAVDIYRTQVMASAVREGANTAARSTGNNIELALQATLAVATSGVKYDAFMTNGLIIVTKMQNYTNRIFLSGFANDATTLGSTGFTTGTNAINMSKLGSSTDIERAGVPDIMKLTNTVIEGKDFYCVEIFYTNRSPLGILGFSQPAMLYDRTFFMAP
jgi:TadE-like protein